MKLKDLKDLIVNKKDLFIDTYIIKSDKMKRRRLFDKKWTETKKIYGNSIVEKNIDKEEEQSNKKLAIA